VSQAGEGWADFNASALLYEIACRPDFGDSLFRHVVGEAKEGAEGDPQRLIELLVRSVEDLQAVIGALEVSFRQACLNPSD